MRPKRPNRPPVTLLDLRAGRVRLYVRCFNCKRTAKLSPFSFDAPGATEVASLMGRLRCKVCRATDGVSAGPEPQEWCAYLVASGQTHRLPWYAAFMREDDGSEDGGSS